MKFLLNWCGVSARSRVPAITPAAAMEEEEEEEKEEREMGSLMELSFDGNNNLPSSKRISISRSRSIPVEQWRPSLCAISEDNVGCVTVSNKAENPVIRSGKKIAGKPTLKPKSKSNTGVVRLHHHHHHHQSSYGYRQASVPAAIPTFTPTVFFF